MSGLYPNVPDVAGVPDVLRQPGASLINSAFLIADLISAISDFGQQQWGIYKDGEPVVVSDNVVSVQYKQEWAIADYQLEQGAFESYDKVERAFNVTVTLSAGGDRENRQAFLESVDAIAGDLNQYDVVTPEATYTGVNVETYDYDRKSYQGSGILIVSVHLKEVRITGVGSVSSASPASGSSASGTTGSVVANNTSGTFDDRFFFNTQSPSSTGQTNSGTVQTTAPTAAQDSQFTSDLKTTPFVF